MNEYLNMWKNAFDFGGKASLKDYWMAVLFNVIASIIIGTVAGIIRLPILATLYSVVAIIPGISLTLRRLRDVGKEFYWIFVSFIPVVGAIWLIIILAKPSNHYSTM